MGYNGGPTVTLAKNAKHFEWSTDKTGAIKELEQKMTVASGNSRQDVTAKFSLENNQTRIHQEQPKPGVDVTRPGLALLRLATRNGGLVIEY